MQTILQIMIIQITFSSLLASVDVIDTDVETELNGNE